MRATLLKALVYRNGRKCVTEIEFEFLNLADYMNSNAKTMKMKTVEMSGRYEFSGKGKDLYKAVVKAHQLMPKGFVTVSADEFVKKPDRFGFEGEWIEGRENITVFEKCIGKL